MFFVFRPRCLSHRDRERGGRLSGILDEFGSEDEEDRGKRRAQLGLREAAGGAQEGGPADDDDDDDTQGEVDIDNMDTSTAYGGGAGLACPWFKLSFGVASCSF